MVKNPYLYLAKRLYNMLKGLGTSDRDLIRIVIGRCEIDLASIEDTFNELPEVRAKNKDLRGMIEVNTDIIVFSLCKSTIVSRNITIFFL